jgi:hypothetical protein
MHWTHALALQTRPDPQLTVVKQATHVFDGPQCGVGGEHCVSVEHGWPPPSDSPERDEDDEPPLPLDPDDEVLPLLLDPDELPPLSPWASPAGAVASASAAEPSSAPVPLLVDPPLVEPPLVEFVEPT